MSQDPVDDPEGPEVGEEAPGPEIGDETSAPELTAEGVEAALERPTEADAAGQFEQRARLAEDRLTEVLDAYRKVKTENEGFRERVTRHLEQNFDRRREKLLLRFIDILDNLDRALEAAEQTYAGNPLIDGLILVRTQLLQTLQGEGLERIPVLGLPYDPTVSEAVGTEAVEDPEHDHIVVREHMRGYRLNGRVARASRVVVGQYREGLVAAARSAEGLVGADEVASSRAVDPAAQTIPLDEKTLREIFGDGDKGGEG